MYRIVNETLAQNFVVEKVYKCIVIFNVYILN